MMRRLLFFTLGSISLVLVVNLLFWAFIGLKIGPIWDEYERGRIVRIGSVAFIFGHGAWKVDTTGVEQHVTIASYRGEKINKSTLDLVNSLYADGVRWIWGTWCYAGDQPYIQRDLITGEEIPWPSYVSRSKSAGVVIPVWLIIGFARFTRGEPRKPHALLEETTLDTLHIPFYWFDVNHETTEKFQARVKRYIGFKLREKGLNVKPDSVNGAYRDTVIYDDPISLRLRNAPLVSYLSPEERRRMFSTRREYWDEYKKRVRDAKKTVQATVWIRGRTIRIWLKIDPYIRDVRALKK